MSESASFAEEFLLHYGYLAEDSRSPSELEAAVKLFQNNHSLTVTGNLDADTVALMRRPRCGVADVVGGVNLVGRGRSISEASCYMVFPGYPKWSRFDLSYTLINFPEAAKPPLRRALQRWAQVSSFTFTESPNPLSAQLKIGFYRGDHGDGHPFGGGRMVAHSFLPMDGRIHFDADRVWSFGDGMVGVDFESVAVHEIGHVLGLDHSQFPQAVMYSGIGPREVSRELNPDDILGIRSLYS